MTYRGSDVTHLQLTLNKVHGRGARIAVGGLCGYGLEQTVDNVGPIRQVFIVMGSTSATELYYVDARTGIVGAVRWIGSSVGGRLGRTANRT